ncbi:YfjI family protein [uncultured Spongiibacter sp.]|uniref:YfjI family protein n=1 Tax=uncultured Spongiibacter sp. TaxID=870896 RepID=UPI0025922663|nr:YfjI family protein [uncultured Spongiibacter sp.]
MTAKLLKSAAPPAEDWPELVPLDMPSLPRLNLEHLPGWVGDYAQAISADTETPPELAAGMVLVTCATAAARRLRVMVKPGYVEPCNLWAVVALPPGNRKSAVQSAATASLITWERDQATIMEPEIQRLTSERKTLEARAKEKRNKAAKEKDHGKAEQLAREAADIEAELPEIPRPTQIWTSDATPERLGSLLAENNECMAWLSSEGGVFDLLQGRYSNGIPNLDLVLKAHSGDAERVDRGSRPPVFLRSPRLSIGLSPQPDVLRGLAAKPGFRGRGLLGRFLYLLPPSPLGYRPLGSNPVPKDVKDAYNAGLRAMLDWEPSLDEHREEQPHVLSLSPEAYSEWYAFAQAIEQQMRPGQPLEHFTDWAGKAPGAAARLAGILHGIKHAHGKPWEAAITADTMTDALEIMAVMTHHSLAAMDMMGTDPSIAAARQVWDWIKRGRRSHFTEREAFNALRSRFPRMDMLRSALSALKERGYLEMIEPPRDGPGRPPSPIVRVRTDISRDWQ